MECKYYNNMEYDTMGGIVPLQGAGMIKSYKMGLSCKGLRARNEIKKEL